MLLIFILIFLLTIFHQEKFRYAKMVCLCLVAKNENKYIIEFLEYYKNYGVDKIFIYDNNDINGERFEDLIGNYIKTKFVELIDFKEIPTPQMEAYNDCYKKHNKYFDWLIFFDTDEYLYLKDFKSIKLFLNEKKFNKCEIIQFNYVFHSDNDLLYYDNRTLLERFPEIDYKKGGKIVKNRSNLKSIIRGNISNVKIVNPHYLSLVPKSCNVFGKKINFLHLNAIKIDYKYYYVNHYYYKSLEEFIEKALKTDAFNKKDISMEKLREYFKNNLITEEKLDYAEKKTKLDLSDFRKKLLK